MYSCILDGLVVAGITDSFVTFEYRKVSLNLPCVKVQEFKSLPKYCQGLYFVFLDKTILYIGASNDIKNRWRSHRVIKKIDRGDVKIAWLPVDDAELMYYFECKLIDYFKPVLNVQRNYKKQIIKAVDATHPYFTTERFNHFFPD